VHHVYVLFALSHSTHDVVRATEVVIDRVPNGAIGRLGDGVWLERCV
jgi:hypothetical protein